MNFGRVMFRGLALAAAVGFGALAAGCDDELDAGSGRSLRPISGAMLALLEQKETQASSPVLIRSYKKEGEFEIWKMKSDGRYTLLKTYPMCRWSGQLGPKTKEGDRQVPEGFYSIAPGQMNPNSHYYLSFNVGYPNAYDRAFGRTGGAVMVHGICSSAGCFSMTDKQIAEIYALTREAFNGGQREIQMQSYPFRMTSENLAKHRLDPNAEFWKQLKNGADHFEVTKTEPKVLICGKRYVFGAGASREVSAGEACPELKRDDDVETQVAARQAEDDQAVATLVKKGVKPIMLVYADGGQHPSFRGYKDASNPEALVGGPQEIVMTEKGKALPPVVEVADRSSTGSIHAAAVASAPAAKPESLVALAPAGAADPNATSLGYVAGFAQSSGGAVKGWFALNKDDEEKLRIYEPEQPIPSDVPLPPRRSANPS